MNYSIEMLIVATSIGFWGGAGLMFHIMRRVVKGIERKPRADIAPLVAETIRKHGPEIAANVMKTNALFQRLCTHDWKVEEGQDLMLPGIPWFVCSRCGKRENTV